MTDHDKDAAMDPAPCRENPLEIFLADCEATEAWGAKMARSRPETGVVYLQGELGAGKSTLARACLRALGVTGAIKSPTYTLVERYPLADGREAVHLDLYRIGQSAELDFLGLDELAATASLWLVEWPERGAGHLPAADLRLDLLQDGAGRRLRLCAQSQTGSDWLALLGIQIVVQMPPEMGIQVQPQGDESR